MLTLCLLHVLYYFSTTAYLHTSLTYVVFWHCRSMQNVTWADEPGECYLEHVLHPDIIKESTGTRPHKICPVCHVYEKDPTYLDAAQKHVLGVTCKGRPHAARNCPLWCVYGKTWIRVADAKGPGNDKVHKDACKLAGERVDRE